MISPTPVSMVSILLFRKNGDLVLLHGEKEDAPHVSTLVGGKVGDTDNKLNEKNANWIALYREMDEELGHPVAPADLRKVFDLTFPHKGQKSTMHVYSGTINDYTYEQLDPPFGIKRTCNIHSLDTNPFKNLHCPIGPLHNHIIQTFRRDGYSKVHYETDFEFMKLSEFSQFMSMQDTLQP